MHLLPYDYFIDAPSDTRGLARTASLIAAARAEVDNCLLLDNGDLLTGTPMADEIARHTDTPNTSGAGSAEPHPMIAVMNRLGYDAATPGNHDFDHGIAFLQQTVAGARFPFVLANVGTPGDGGAMSAVTQGGRPRTLLPPCQILERRLRDDRGQSHDLKIGVIGALPPRSLHPHRAMRQPPPTWGIVEAVRPLVPELRARGADLVVLLAHTGIGAATCNPGMENALIPLSRVPGIDAIVGGHAHQLFPVAKSPHPDGEVSWSEGRINGVPVVMPGFWGSHLGVIDLELRAAGPEGASDPAARRWAVTGSQVSLRPIYQRDNTGQIHPTVPDDPTIATLLARNHQRTLAYVRTPVGYTPRRLHSYFSLIAPNGSVQLVQRAQRAFAARRLADTPHAHLPILSSATSLKCGGIGGPRHFTDVPSGEMTLRAIADLYLFPNDLVALKVDGTMLRAWLERAASVFHRLTPNAPDQPLIDPDTPCYLYETVLGLSYRIDLTRPALYTPQGAPVAGAEGTEEAEGAEGAGQPGRIRDLRLNGQPLRPSDQAILVTNGFRLAGGGRYPIAPDAQQVLDAGPCIRDILCDHLRAGPVADQPPEPHWQLSAPPGCSATLECSPRAVPLMPELNDAPDMGRLSDLGRLPNGFQSFRLVF